MQRMIRWVDAEGQVGIGIELEEEGQFFRITGTDDPLRVLHGEAFEVDPVPVVPLDH